MCLCVKGGPEGVVELGLDGIQFGAPSSAGSTDSDGGPVLLEAGLPAPKEQRQKQSRAGPIKTQKVRSSHTLSLARSRSLSLSHIHTLSDRKSTRLNSSHL